MARDRAGSAAPDDRAVGPPWSARTGRVLPGVAARVRRRRGLHAVRGRLRLAAAQVEEPVDPGHEEGGADEVPQVGEDPVVDDVAPADPRYPGEDGGGQEEHV